MDKQIKEMMCDKIPWFKDYAALEEIYLDQYNKGQITYEQRSERVLQIQEEFRQKTEALLNNK